MYKLNITWNMDIDDEEKARAFSKEIIDSIRTTYMPPECPSEVSLTRHGDRSGANLLAKTPDGRHYRNQKIPLTEVGE